MQMTSNLYTQIYLQKGKTTITVGTRCREDQLSSVRSSLLSIIIVVVVVVISVIISVISVISAIPRLNRTINMRVHFTLTARSNLLCVEVPHFLIHRLASKVSHFNIRRELASKPQEIKFVCSLETTPHVGSTLVVAIPANNFVDVLWEPIVTKPSGGWTFRA